jgi:hypothetical protein
MVRLETRDKNAVFISEPLSHFVDLTLTPGFVRVPALFQPHFRFSPRDFFCVVLTG